jgi:DNA polymerase type B, organellar and viral
MPHKDPAARAAYRKAYNQQHREKRNIQLRERRRQTEVLSPFVGVDGEGGEINGRHEYLLLRAGDKVLETGRPLRTLECLQFLYGLEEHRRYVSYFFTYDVTMILRDMPLGKVKDLLNREVRTSVDGTQTRRVSWQGFMLDWLPGKEFRVGKYVGPGHIRWVIIDDVGAFFQCSFVEALRRWNVGDETLLKRIAASKAKRSSFRDITDLTRLYNKKECDLLVLLMNEFRRVCGEVGPYPRHWQGPGNLASAWLNSRHVPYEHNVPYEAMSMARDAYYGGRFEITAVGSIRRKIYQYDINSAYPAVIRTLPCLIHGAWKHSINTTPRRPLYVAQVRFSHRADTFLGTLPIRSPKGNIYYPIRGEGVYWSTELSAARRAGCQIQILESWEYIKECSCKPLDWMEEVYTHRKRVGKSNKGNALKLAMNSIYGKFAQSIGRPKWANPVWAGLITATTRAQIIDACTLVQGQNVLMIATDGIFTDKPLNLPIGSGLGEWELTEHSSIFILQPGMYLLPDKGVKTRGVPRMKIEGMKREILKTWAVRPRTMEIPLVRFRALRQAVHENKLVDAGQWYDELRHVSFDWTTKRDPDNGYWEEWKYPQDRPCFRPAIKQGGEASIAYGKSIGMWELSRRFEDDQPEGAETLTSEIL